MSDDPSACDGSPEEIKQYALRYLRRAITRLELDEASGVVVILLNDKGIDRLWCAVPQHRYVLAELSTAAAGLGSTFCDAWASLADKDVPNELSPPGMVPVDDL